MEFVAISHHAGLSWLRCLDAVTGLCSSWLGCIRTPNDANAHVHFGPHAAAIAEHGGVPPEELFDADLLEAEELATCHAFGDPVEFRTVCGHAWLSWQRGLNAVAGVCGGAGSER